MALLRGVHTHTGHHPYLRSGEHVLVGS